jgi:hypothetical protein
MGGVVMNTTLDRKIAAESAKIKRIEKEEAADLRATQEAIALQAENKQKLLSGGVSVYGSLKVSWTQDGEEVSVAHEGNLTPAEMATAVTNIPGIVSNRMRETGGSGAERFIPRRQLVSEYRRRCEERATAIFHAQERIADLKAEG